MGALWRRRAARHVLVGLLPLLLAGVAVATVLALRYGDASAPVQAATGRATATVLTSGGGADGREVELRWTDERGTERVSRVRASGGGAVPVGRTVSLRFDPADPGGQVYVGGDETSARLRDLSFGLVLTILVLLAVLAASAVHLARRRAAERRPAARLPVRYARSRRGVVQRSWLVMTDGGADWWVPVHWDPALTTLKPGTNVPVHGRPGRDRLVVADVGEVPVWQAGRRRPTAPAGELTTAPLPAGETPPAIGLGRHFRSDGGLLAVAPVAGLLWAYLDGTGAAGWGAASAIAVGVLVWLPTVIGTDPT